MVNSKLVFLFVGPQKTGTTWVYEQLKNHPEICFPKDVKETFFFDKYYEKGLNWYEWHFKHCRDEQLIGEVAPTYFVNKEVPNRIKQVNKECKIFITLRNPIEKARSLYHHKIKYGELDSNSDFSKAVEKFPNIITSGYYANHISRWYREFDQDDIFFYLLDDIKKSPQKVLQNIFYNLNIEYIMNDELMDKKVNKSTAPKSKRLANYAVNLAGYLRSHRLHKVVELGKQLGLKKIYEGDGRLPNLKKGDIEMLQNKYEKHIQYIESQLELSLRHWRYIK